MKFDVDYDKIVKDETLQKTKILKRGARPKKTDFANSDHKTHFEENSSFGSNIILHKFRMGPVLQS